MPVHPTRKQEIVAEFARSEGDTGSPEVQVALLTERIAELTAHLKVHRKDVSTRRGLVNMVARRAKLVRYLRNTDLPRYRALVDRLGLRG